MRKQIYLFNERGEDGTKETVWDGRYAIRVIGILRVVLKGTLLFTMHGYIQSTHRLKLRRENVSSPYAPRVWVLPRDKQVIFDGDLYILFFCQDKHGKSGHGVYCL